MAAADLAHMRIHALPLSFLVGCVPFEPPSTEPATTAITSETGSPGSSGWQIPPRERGPISATSTTSTTTTNTTSTTGLGPATSESTASDLTTGSVLEITALQIAELHPDPDGKDGGAASPEFLELVHVGEAPLDLVGLEILARAWPTLRGDEIGLAGHILAPGERLLLLRFAEAGDVPKPAIAAIAGGLRVAFASAEGLRNADGGILLRTGDAIGDTLIHGAAQPAPWSSGLWNGEPAPAPGPGQSLCRASVTDHDDASDWISCPPSPGAAPDLEDGSTTADESTGTTGEPLPAEVAIMEVLSNPVGPGNLEKTAEFVEVMNLGPGTVDLGTWTIADDASETPTGADPLLYLAGDGGCEPATCLAPGQRALIVGNAYTGPTGVGLVLVTDDTTIANAGLGVHEPVVLRDASKVLRSTYRVWPDPLVMPDPALTEEALVRDDPAAPDEPGAWSFAAPTPGQ
jgi:hypothetical protein